MPHTALWKTIAETLRDEIAAKTYGPGQKLPTEADLSKRFGVNRHTVRRALAQLSDEDLIITRRGAGAFVATHVTDYPLVKRMRFAKSVLAAGRTPARQTLRLETVLASAEDAEALAIAEGSGVHLYEALSFIDEAPVAMARSVFPAARFPSFHRSLRTVPSITAAFAADGLTDYTRASTRISALLATATQAQHLQINVGAPLLFTRAINVDPDGSPVEFGQTWFCGDRMMLTLDEDNQSDPM